MIEIGKTLNENIVIRKTDESGSRNLYFAPIAEIALPLGSDYDYDFEMAPVSPELETIFSITEKEFKLIWQEAIQLDYYAAVNEVFQHSKITLQLCEEIQELWFLEELYIAVITDSRILNY